MSVLISVSTVLFLILCVLLTIIILLQSDKSAGMGILGGSSQTTFGSSTADVITKITTVMVALFMVGSLGLSIMESYRAKSYDAKPEGMKTPAKLEKTEQPQKAEAPKGVQKEQPVKGPEKEKQ